MEQQRLYFTASDVLLSEQESSQFLSVTMRMLSTRVNRNNEGVTEAFIDEIVANPEKYYCTPLYADTKKLKAHQYKTLGHMFDRRTGRFLTDQIGSFCSFSKVNDEFGVSLYGEARVPKREDDICAALAEMYDLGSLNFSFEITYVPDATQTIDGALIINADERNALTGMAVVSVPAYPEATALALVAETEAINEDSQTEEQIVAGEEPNGITEKEVSDMDKQKNGVAEEVVETVEREAETEHAVSETEEVTETQAEVTEAMTEETVQIDTNSDSNIERAAVVEVNPVQTLAEPFPLPIEEPEHDPESEPEPQIITIETVEEFRTRIVTLERVVAEKDAAIAELNAQMSDYTSMKAELETYRAEAANREHEQKISKAETYAKKLGLDTENEDVKKAISELNYETLADLVMQIQEPEVKEVAVSSIVSDMKIVDENTYGGLVGKHI